MAIEEPRVEVSESRGGQARGCNMLMLVILLVLVAGLAAWAWVRNPPQTPSPSATSSPQTVPGGQAPQS